MSEPIKRVIYQQCPVCGALEECGEGIRPLKIAAIAVHEPAPVFDAGRRSTLMRRETLLGACPGSECLADVRDVTEDEFERVWAASLKKEHKVERRSPFGRSGFCKEFRCCSVSKNANSFGLTGHILVAQDGEAWQVGRSRGAWNDPQWDPGSPVIVTYQWTGSRMEPNFAGLSCEIPSKLKDCPPAIVAEIWKLPNPHPKKA